MELSELEAAKNMMSRPTDNFLATNAHKTLEMKFDLVLHAFICSAEHPGSEFCSRGRRTPVTAASGGPKLTQQLPYLFSSTKTAL